LAARLMEPLPLLLRRLAGISRGRLRVADGLLRRPAHRLHGADPGYLLGRHLLRPALGPGRPERRWRPELFRLAGGPPGIRSAPRPGPAGVPAVLHLSRAPRPR